MPSHPIKRRLESRACQVKALHELRPEASALQLPGCTWGGSLLCTSHVCLGSRICWRRGKKAFLEMLPHVPAGFALAPHSAPAFCRCSARRLSHSVEELRVAVRGKEARLLGANSKVSLQARSRSHPKRIRTKEFQRARGSPCVLTALDTDTHARKPTRGLCQASRKHRLGTNMHRGRGTFLLSLWHLCPEARKLFVAMCGFCTDPGFAGLAKGARKDLHQHDTPTRTQQAGFSTWNCQNFSILNMYPSSSLILGFMNSSSNGVFRR